jgi:dipeptidase D
MNPTEKILSLFEQISAIPRCTKDEAAIRSWLQSWSAGRELGCQTDAAGNLVIHVPASAGYENRPVLILQGHLDMVCQKTADSTHDFSRDPIRLIRDGDWLKTDGTTLGADNGIAIALMMALVEDESVLHPPLELLFTVEEEIGMVGAKNLDPGMLNGKTLINLDSEHEGVFVVGCAGGGSVEMTLPVSWSPQSPDEIGYELKVSGLRGGHSGEDINKQRVSAIKLIARILDFIQRDVPLRLSTLASGTARNAIPREADAFFLCPKDEAEICHERFADILQIVSAEYAQSESGLNISLTEISSQTVEAISRAETAAGIRLLVNVPYGVMNITAEVPNLVETSANIGVMELKEDGFFIVSSFRSSEHSRLEEMLQRAESLAWLAGAQTQRANLSQPWQPNFDSAILKKLVDDYRLKFNEEPAVRVIHAGLECGIISRRCGGLDAISIGPTIENPHSPDERLFIPSLGRIWELLKLIGF